MSFKSVMVNTEIYLSDISDSDLIGEIEYRGYKVTEDIDEETVIEDLLQEVIDWYKRGDVKEALIQLEKIEPQLYGISEKVKY